jgi:transcriptional regulator with XRE-family HTH domain
MENNLKSKIREKRRRKGWTQADLAEKTGVSANYIALVERGRKVPSLRLLLRIADALGVSVSFLIEKSLVKDLEELKRQYNPQELKEALIDFVKEL